MNLQIPLLLAGLIALSALSGSTAQGPPVTLPCDLSQPDLICDAGAQPMPRILVVSCSRDSPEIGWQTYCLDTIDLDTMDGYAEVNGNTILIHEDGVYNIVVQLLCRTDRACEAQLVVDGSPVRTLLTEGFRDNAVRPVHFELTTVLESGSELELDVESRSGVGWFGGSASGGIQIEYLAAALESAR